MMSRETNLELAIADLGRLLGVRTQHDLMRVLFRKATDKNFSDEQIALEQFDSKSEDTELTKIISALINITDGGMLISDFQEVWSSFLSKAEPEDAEKYVDSQMIPFTILSNGKNIQNVSEISPKEMSIFSNLEASSTPEKWNPSFGSVQFHNVALNFSNRYSSAATVFLSAIPTVELSRCVPYLDVKLITNTKTVDARAQQPPDANAISLFRFLYGKEPFRNEDSSSLINIKLINERLETDKYGPDGDLVGGEDSVKTTVESTAAGMEIFTSPQTLVNGDEAFYDLEPIDSTNADVHLNRKTPIIDKFRPFMTLNNFSLTVQPTFGTLSTKQGSMNITLHDRSRLAEISQLTSPGEFQNVEFLIEYGWSHPDSDSPYGKILNAFRTRQKFISIGSSYSFNPQGEVAIDIKLLTKGSNQFNYALVTDAKIQPLLEKMKNIIQIMNKLEKGVKSEYESELKDIMNGGEILGKLNSIEGMVSLSAKQISSLEKSILKLDKEINNANLDSLIKDLKDSVGLGDKSEPSTIKRYKSELERSISELMKDIENQPDPYLKAIDPSLGIVNTKTVNKVVGYEEVENPEWTKSQKVPGMEGKKRVGPRKIVDIPKYIKKAKREKQTIVLSSKYVSLGKLLYLFVASPLASKHLYDEIQFLFYPLNAYASFARNADVASFPILKSKFQELFRKRLERNPTITLGQFVGFINKYFFSNLASEVFGFGNIYERDQKTAAAKLRAKFKSKKAKRKAIDTKTDILTKAYGGTGQKPKFKKPALSLHMECVPASGDSERTIMRIHFFDKSTSSFESYADLWNSTKSSYLSGVQTTISNSVKNLKNIVESEDKKNAGNASMAISGHEQLMQSQLSKLDALGLFVPIDDQGKVAQSDSDLIGSTTLTTSKVKYYRLRGGPLGLRHYFARNMPTIKYGTEYSAILNASVSTQSDPAMQMVHMERQGRKENLPGSEVNDGLPLVTFPISLSLEMFGCPLINFGQQYFVDFQTGTTIDDIYRVNGVEHSFSPNDFKTQVQMIPVSRSGEFVSTQSQITQAIKELEDIKQKYSDE